MADKTEIFHQRMMDSITPGSSAKELVEKIVKSALEVEFGSEFAVNPGFSKMVSKIADTLVSNPELRRQALSVAGTYITRKMEKPITKTPEPKKVYPKHPIPIKAYPFKINYPPSVNL